MRQTRAKRVAVDLHTSLLVFAPACCVAPASCPTWWRTACRGRTRRFWPWPKPPTRPVRPGRRPTRSSRPRRWPEGNPRISRGSRRAGRKASHRSPAPASAPPLTRERHGQTPTDVPVSPTSSIHAETFLGLLFSQRRQDDGQVADGQRTQLLSFARALSLSAILGFSRARLRGARIPVPSCASFGGQDWPLFLSGESKQATRQGHAGTERPGCILGS